MNGASCGESGVGRSRVPLLVGVPLGIGFAVSGMVGAGGFALFLGRLGSLSSSELFSSASMVELERS